MNKRWIEAAGYKDYDDYHRAHTKYHALTKKQEETLKSSKAYKVGETVGDIASYFVGYGGAPNSQSNNPISNMTNMMKSFNQFKNSFTGDPKQTVMNLLSSGQMSQTQFGQLQEMAKQFSKLIGH